MEQNIIMIVALISLCIGVFLVLWKRDIFKDKASNLKITTSGFVVSVISLLVIYYINR